MRRVALTIAVAAGMLVGMSASAAAQTASSVAGVSRVAIDSEPDFSNLQQTGERHSYVILQVWRQSEAAAIKAADPSVRVLAYKNLSAANSTSGPGGLISSGVSYQEANSSHPEWFLKTSGGQRFTFDSYSYLWAMNIGRTGYQNRWAQNVIADLQAGPWDGVFVDDTNPTIKYHYDPDKVEPSLNTDAEYQQATGSALATIAPQIQQAGFLVVPNFGAWGEYSDAVNKWLPYVDGAMDEMFLKWGNSAGEGYAWSGRWEAQLHNLQLAQSQGKDFIAVTHSDDGDVQAARYGYATTLLGSEGSASFALHHDYSHENWFDFYSAPIGAPEAKPSRDSNGVWRRRFSNGLVLVNPEDSARQVSFGGTYSGSGLEGATSTTMAAHTGLVLNGESTNEPPAEDPPAEDPPAEQPSAEDPPAEQPSAEDPPSDEQPAATAGTRRRGSLRIKARGRRSVRLRLDCPDGGCKHRITVKARGRSESGSRVRTALARRTLSVDRRETVRLRLGRRARTVVRTSAVLRVRAVSVVSESGDSFRLRSRSVRVS